MSSAYVSLAVVASAAAAVILRITWRSWQTVRAHNRQDHRHS